MLFLCDIFLLKDIILILEVYGRFKENKEYSERKLCGVSNTEIFRIESGSRSEFSPTVLIKLVKYLNINYITWIYTL